MRQFARPSALGVARERYRRGRGPRGPRVDAPSRIASRVTRMRAGKGDHERAKGRKEGRRRDEGILLTAGADTAARTVTLRAALTDDLRTLRVLPLRATLAASAWVETAKAIVALR